MKYDDLDHAWRTIEFTVALIEQAVEGRDADMAEMRARALVRGFEVMSEQFPKPQEVLA